MFNLYEIEQLGQARRQQLQEEAIQYRQRSNLADASPSIQARTVLACSDILIALGYKLKSWYQVDRVRLEQYQLKVKDMA